MIGSPEALSIYHPAPSTASRRLKIACFLKSQLLTWKMWCVWKTITSGNRDGESGVGDYGLRVKVYQGTARKEDLQPCHPERKRWISAVPVMEAPEIPDS